MAWWRCSVTLEVPRREAGTPPTPAAFALGDQLPSNPVASSRKLSPSLLCPIFAASLADRSSSVAVLLFSSTWREDSEGEAVRRSRGPRPAEALRPAAGSARGPGTPACDCYSSAPTHRLLRAGPRCPGPGQGLFVAWVSEQRGRRAPARGRTQRCRPSQRPGHPRRPGSRRCDGSQASYTRFTYILGNMENIKQGSLRREN